MKTASKPEAKLLAACRRYLDTLGADVWHHKLHGSIYGPTGVPDLLVCLRGRWLMVEIKAAGKEPTRKQLYMANRIRRAGGIVATIDCLEDFLALVEAQQ